MVQKYKIIENVLALQKNGETIGDNKMNIKQLIRTIYRLVFFRQRASSESYIKFLRKKGINIGKGTVIFSPETFSCDTLNPHLLSIGENVQITEYVTILTHDYSWSVIKNMDGCILGNQKNVRIGNNVFIGQKSIMSPPGYN